MILAIIDMHDAAYNDTNDDANHVADAGDGYDIDRDNKLIK